MVQTPYTSIKMTQVYLNTKGVKAGRKLLNVVHMVCDDADELVRISLHPV